MSRARSRLRLPLATSLVLFATLAWLPACEPEECSADFQLGGAIDWIWVWRHPSTTCEVWSQGLLGSDPEIEFTNDGGDSLSMTLAGGDLAVGSYPATIVYSQSYDSAIWTNGGTSTTCLVNILSYELVDWVREDRHRFRGNVVCSGELYNSVDGSTLTLSEVLFSVYVPDMYGIF